VHSSLRRTSFSTSAASNSFITANPRDQSWPRYWASYVHLWASEHLFKIRRLGPYPYRSSKWTLSRSLRHQNLVCNSRLAIRATSQFSQFHLPQTQLMLLTLIRRGTRIESQSLHLLSRMRIVVIFFSPFKQILGWCLSTWPTFCKSFAIRYSL
jgi:hypothetical protein